MKIGTEKYKYFEFYLIFFNSYPSFWEKYNCKNILEAVASTAYMQLHHSYLFLSFYF